MAQKHFSSLLITLSLTLILLFVTATFALSANSEHPVEELVGERMEYDISFLWFKHLAEGSIRLERGKEQGTYLATMEARTLGLAAFVTRQRVEKYQTLMEIGPNGLLRPQLHSSHTFRGTGASRKEKRTTYRFDFANRRVNYHKIKSAMLVADEDFELGTAGNVYDILSAFYNLRLGTLGEIGQQQINIPALHRKGSEEIVVAPITEQERKREKFFAATGRVCKVLVDPEVFKTQGRELFVSFDEAYRLDRGIIKNVIGLGDVKGVLR